MKNVSEIMSRNPYIVHSDDTLEKIYNILTSQKFAALPVVENDEIVGIITWYDLKKYQFRDYDQMRVEEAMSKNPIIISQDTPVDDAKKLMNEKRFGSLLIEENNKLVGIVTRGDIKRSEKSEALRPAKRGIGGAIMGCLISLLLIGGITCGIVWLINKSPATTESDQSNQQTGQYKEYYLGLVKNPEVQGGTGCYDSKGDFVVLINNQNAINPTYSQLVSFLQSDRTDEFAYQLSFPVSSFYYGEAEDTVDLANVKEIIDGITEPKPPQICADFAERLHNNAEMVSIRCGYVIINNLNHALNAFETTDRGLVFIDDTGKRKPSLQILTTSMPNSITFGEPTSWDKVAYVSVGKPYGLIDLKSATFFGLAYTGYEKWLGTKRELDALETEKNRIAGGRTYVPQDTYNQIQHIRSQEIALANQLGGFWDSLGIVDSYFITWDGNWRDRK